MFKLKGTKFLVYTALLCALSVVVKRFGTLDLFGGAIKLSLFYLPVFTAGILLGPLGGFIAGAVGDLFGTMLLYGAGSINPVIMLSAGLMGALMGLCFLKGRNLLWLRVLIGGVATLCICTMGLGTLGLTLPPTSYFASYSAAFLARLPMQPLILGINVGLTEALIYALLPALRSLKLLPPQPKKTEVEHKKAV